MRQQTESLRHLTGHIRQRLLQRHTQLLHHILQLVIQGIHTGYADLQQRTVLRIAGPASVTVRAHGDVLGGDPSLFRFLHALAR